jgi:hypothetical protein
VGRRVTPSGFSPVIRPVAAFAVLVLVVLAAGCGNSGGDDIEQARDTVRDYVMGIAEGDGERACGRMSEAAQEQLAARVAEEDPQSGIDTCEEAVERLGAQLDAEDLAPLRDPQIDVTLNRDKATASVADGPSDVTVIKVGGEWLIDDG